MNGIPKMEIQPRPTSRMCTTFPTCRHALLDEHEITSMKGVALRRDVFFVRILLVLLPICSGADALMARDGI